MKHELRGMLALPSADERVALAPGVMTIEDGVIASIECDDELSQADRQRLISPGFIDAHVHLPQWDSVGVGGLRLLEWLERVIFPAEAAWADVDVARGVASRAIAGFDAAGTTGIAAYCTVHHDAARAAGELVAASGRRALVGQVLMDMGAPEVLCRPAAQLLDEAASLEHAGRMKWAVTPRFALSCSEELLAGAGALARERDAAVQTHLSETVEECARVAELFGGPHYTGVYERFGLLGPRSVCAHGVQLDDAQRDVLAASGTVIAHCPTANTFLGAGRMDLASLRAAGVRVAVGSDVAGGPDRCMVRVARAMLEVAGPTDPGVRPSPAEAWWAITGGNADALGWDDTGRLAVGHVADVVVIEPDAPWTRSPDPLGAVLWGWDDRWLRATLVAGRVAYGAI